MFARSIAFSRTSVRHVSRPRSAARRATGETSFGPPRKPQVVQKSPSHRRHRPRLLLCTTCGFSLAVARFRPRLTRRPPSRIRATLLSVTPLASVAPCCGSICGAASGAPANRIALGARRLRRRCSPDATPQRGCFANRAIFVALAVRICDVDASPISSGHPASASLQSRACHCQKSIFAPYC